MEVPRLARPLPIPQHVHFAETLLLPNMQAAGGLAEKKGAEESEGAAPSSIGRRHPSSRYGRY